MFGTCIFTTTRKSSLQWCNERSGLALQQQDAPTCRACGPMAPGVCDPYVSRFSHSWTNLALVSHGPATIPRTGAGPGPRSGVCRPLDWWMLLRRVLILSWDKWPKCLREKTNKYWFVTQNKCHRKYRLPFLRLSKFGAQRCFFIHVSHHSQHSLCDSSTFQRFSLGVLGQRTTEREWRNLVMGHCAQRRVVEFRRPSALVLPGLNNFRLIWLSHRSECYVPQTVLNTYFFVPSVLISARSRQIEQFDATHLFWRRPIIS